MEVHHLRTAPRTVVEVLVVGAGPVGLSTATALAAWGVDVAVVDADPGPTEQSRAVLVHARTLELLDGLGVAEGLRAEGVAFDRVVVHRGGTEAGDIPYDGTGRSRFPGGVLVEQSRTQAHLLRAAAGHGVRPRWERRVTGLVQRDDHVEVTLVATAGGPDGAGSAPEVVHARWVVGADGASSAVRRAVGLELVGETYPTSFFTGDLLLRTPLDRRHAHLSVTTRRTFALLPLPGRDRWRVVATVPPEVERSLGRGSGPTGGPALAPEQVRGLLADLRVPHQLLGQQWATLYRSHHRVVDDFRAGRVLLAGDAAHVHSPAGGLGMNTGVGDAADLAWRLALVVLSARSATAGRAPGPRVDAELLLDAYSAERRSVALQVLRTSDRAFVLQAGSGRALGVVRTTLVPLVPRLLRVLPHGRRLAFDALSQTRTTYRGLAAAAPPAAGTARRRRRRSPGPEAGDRLPYAAAPGGATSHDAISPTGFSVVAAGDPRGARQLAALLEEKGLPARVRVLDATLAVGVGLRPGAAVVVRPDGHVLWAGDLAGSATLEPTLAAAGLVRSGLAAGGGERAGAAAEPKGGGRPQRRP